MTFRAAGRPAILAALYNAVKKAGIETAVGTVKCGGIPIVIRQITVNGTYGKCRSRVVIVGNPVIGIVVELMVRTKKTHAQAEVQRQTRGCPPVILNIGFHNLVALAVSSLAADLAENRNREET